MIDLTDPAAPRLLARVNGIGSWWKVVVVGTRAFLAGLDERDRGVLTVLDIIDPSQPREIGRARIPESDRLGVAGLVVLGPYAYVIISDDFSAQLEVFDVSNPANPVRVGGNASLRGHSIAVFGGKILVASDNNLTLLNPFIPLRLEPGTQHPSGLRLWVGGPPDWPVRVQRSADLTAWQDWQTVTLGDTPVEVADPEAASQPHRFYRAAGP